MSQLQWIQVLKYMKSVRVTGYQFRIRKNYCAKFLLRESTIYNKIIIAGNVGCIRWVCILPSSFHSMGPFDDIQSTKSNLDTLLLFCIQRTSDKLSKWHLTNAQSPNNSIFRICRNKRIAFLSITQCNCTRAQTYQITENNRNHWTVNTVCIIHP